MIRCARTRIGSGAAARGAGARRAGARFAAGRAFRAAGLAFAFAFGLAVRFPRFAVFVFAVRRVAMLGLPWAAGSASLGTRQEAALTNERLFG